MSEKETPFNLFSAPPKKPPPKEGSSLPPPPLKPSKKIDPLGLDAGTREILNQIQEMQEDIVSRADNAARRLGMTKEQILEKIQKAAGSSMEAQKMNADIKAFAERVWGALGPDIVPDKQPKVKGTLSEKDRKGKTLGARRNWMRMP